MQCAEIETAVASIGERSEIRGRVRSESECMVTRTRAGLEVAQYGVEALQLGQLLWLFSADNATSPIGPLLRSVLPSCSRLVELSLLQQRRLTKLPLTPDDALARLDPDVNTDRAVALLPIPRTESGL